MLKISLCLFLLLVINDLMYVIGKCPHDCSSNGYCGENGICECYVDSFGDPVWTGNDCSLKTCPKDVAWIIASAVDGIGQSPEIHPIAECSNKGICNRASGVCECFDNFEGIACERTVCPNDCSNRGLCLTQYQFADDVDRVYATAWDAEKQVGCLCDSGYRGYDCSLVECSSGPDPLKGHGAKEGRDCSGRGICDYLTGSCNCFDGFGGIRCQNQLAFYS